MEFIRKVREAIIKYSMLSGNDRVLIGLSGGPDSVCLAVILDKLRKDFNLLLSAVYIDHGLRPGEVKKEIEFCKDFCNRFRIDFYERAIDVKKFAGDEGLNLQEAARELRYGVYEEISENIKADRIALGHNADDQAETILMRLFRGSGRKGLAGIPPKRGRIIRPLIETERKDIEAFLAGAIHESPLHSRQHFIIDSSNLKEKYSRNWIRLSLMGEIRKKYPAAVHDICRTSEIFREEDEYLELIVTKTLMRLISRKSDSSIELFLRPLETIEIPVLRRVLRRAIEATKGLRGISFVHIEEIIRLIKEGKSGNRLDLPKNIRVVREYSILKITTEKPLTLSGYEIQPPCEIKIKEADIVLKALFEEEGGETGDGRTSVLLDAGNMTFPLGIRARAAGDFFYPLGFGKKKKLQDFFVDEKIPRDERDITPIVVSGNDIIWVAGYRADERFKVTDKTDKFLRLIVLKKNIENRRTH
ncbi:MAG TPA: tRNA lysidine(34) synthetase TilS [Nitrospirae bacterium]|nr:tRNA(Ile)-lysidine synthase [bacterium BMS3Abin06]HDH12650.1 tRNA lysidine(34) synthetase TilS [Nitrospirota bacterium]HDY99958.1 tRNA lysidine(34) synthetase TilS [Nitrospirota bacterium]